jgi:hypothetical protein
MLAAETISESVETDPLALVQDQRLRRFARYWLDKRGGHNATRRADIDPTEIPWILPLIWLYDYEPDGQRLRCRLAGESIRETYPMNIVGRCMDEFLPASEWPDIRAHYLSVLDGASIGHARGRVYRPEIGQGGYVERVILPLSDESGARNTMLIGATSYSLRSIASPEALVAQTRSLIPLASLS